MHVALLYPWLVHLLEQSIVVVVVVTVVVVVAIVVVAAIVVVVVVTVVVVVAIVVVDVVVDAEGAHQSVFDDEHCPNNPRGSLSHEFRQLPVVQELALMLQLSEEAEHVLLNMHS